MTRLLVCLALVLSAAPAAAQPVPVQPWADWASYGTAIVNPAVAAITAWRAPDRGCRFAQLAISEAVGNGLALALQHTIASPRPCLGCPSTGMPSAHAMNSTIGVSAGWRVGMTFPVSTAGLRLEAHRHTPWQVVAGVALGLGAEAAGHLLPCP